MSFYVSVGHLHTFSGKNYSALLPIFLIELFVFLLLSCMSSLYILDLHPLSDIRFTNIFSHSVNCLFVLPRIYVSKKVLVSCSLICLFINLFLPKQPDQTSNNMLKFMSKIIIPVFSRNFLVWNLKYLNS